MICNTCHGSGAVVLGARDGQPGSGMDAEYDYGKCPDCDGPFVLSNIPLVANLLKYFTDAELNGKYQHEEANLVEAMTALGHDASSVPLALDMMYNAYLIGRQIRDSLWGIGCPLNEKDTYEPPSFD